MRRLLGRYLALKAKEHKGVVEISDAESGLGEPLVSIQLRGSGVDVQLHIGKPVSDGQRYFSVSGLTERVIALRDGLLEDYNFSTEMTRNPYLVDFMDDTDGVVEIQFDGPVESSSLLHNEGCVEWCSSSTGNHRAVDQSSGGLSRSGLEWNERMGV